MELERADRIICGLHDDATAARRILSNQQHQQQQMTTIIRNTKETVLGQAAPDLAEDWRCIDSQSEDDQIRNSASFYPLNVPGLNQTNEIKEYDNTNSLKDYEILTNKMPETMSAQESSSNMTDMETMILSKKGLCSGHVETQEAKLQREDDKKPLNYEDSNSLESKDFLSEPHSHTKEQHFSNVKNLGTGVLGHVNNRDSTESPNKVIRAGEHDTIRCTPCKKSHIIRGRSPMNWFPRRRTESYLERKIRMLQEVEGMNRTLDETLGGSYPHLSRLEREKLAAQAAAGAAIEARKAALVEGAWCRILKAARIPCELAEVELQNAEKKAAEAFDAAAALGVVMHNKPGGPKQSLEVETYAANGSQTHAVSASFETAFEVDKEVAGAVKIAFSHLAHLPAFATTDIFNFHDDAVRRVSIKPDGNDTALDNHSVGFDGLSSESEAQTEGEQQADSDLKNNTDATVPCTHRNNPKCLQSKKEPANEVGISEELIDLMLERVKLLKEEELVSLAMIVATRGLSAMLKEENKEPELNGECNSGSLGDILVKHVSRLEAEKAAAAAASKVVVPRDPKKKATPEILPDLGSILVKHVSKLEREVQEARKLAKAMQSEDRRNSRGFQEQVESLLGDSRKLGSLFVRHASNSEREVPVTTEFIKSPQREEQRSTCESEGEKLTVEGENIDYDKENRDVNTASTKINAYATTKVNPENTNNLVNNEKPNFSSTLSVSDPGTKHAMKGVQKKQHHYNENQGEGLEKLLVKHVSRLEKEKLAALTLERESSQRLQRNQYQGESFDNILVKNVSELEMMKMAAAKEGLYKTLKIQQQDDLKIEEGLDKILIKHVSKLEREKQETSPKAFERVQGKHAHHDENNCGSLDKVLVKRLCRLEKEKQEASPEAFERVQRKHDHHDENHWESLDKVLVKRLCRLEKEKQEASPEAFARVQRKHDHHDENHWGSLDKVLVKRLSRLEKEKQEASPEAFERVKRKQHHHDENSWGSLDNILVKHLSPLEKEKLTASRKGASEGYEKLSSIFSFGQDAAENNSVLQRHKNARDQEIQHAWGGVSLGKTLRPHLSKLELDKAAWHQAEEEELKRASQC